MNGKPAVASLTMWGIFFAFICSTFPNIASALHLTDPATQAAFTSFVSGIGTVIGLAVALWGRVNATQAITSLFTAKPKTATTGTPPGAANVFAFIVAAIVGLFLIGPVLAACSTATSTTPVATTSATTTTATLRLTEGKALTASYQAADSLAVALDAAAKSGVLKGTAALQARQALMDIQVGLSTAQSAYAAGSASAAGQIASLASLFSSASALIPLNASTTADVQSAIQLAQVFATAAS